MKDYVFEKPIPFVTEDVKKSDDKLYKSLSYGLSFVFDNDQRNIIYFAFGLGIPGLIIAFFGLFLSSGGNPILVFFDVLLVLFVAWVFWAMYNMYTRLNKRLSDNKN